MSLERREGVVRQGQKDKRTLTRLLSHDGCFGEEARGTHGVSLPQRHRAVGKQVLNSTGCVWSVVLESRCVHAGAETCVAPS